MTVYLNLPRGRRLRLISSDVIWNHYYHYCVATSSVAQELSRKKVKDIKKRQKKANPGWNSVTMPLRMNSGSASTSASWNKDFFETCFCWYWNTFTSCTVAIPNFFRSCTWAVLHLPRCLIVKLPQFSCFYHLAHCRSVFYVVLCQMSRSRKRSNFYRNNIEFWQTENGKRMGS